MGLGFDRFKIGISIDDTFLFIKWRFNGSNLIALFTVHEEAEKLRDLSKCNK